MINGCKILVIFVAFLLFASLAHVLALDSTPIAPPSKSIIKSFKFSSVNAGYNKML